MRNSRNSHSLLAGMQTGTATLGDSLAVSYKLNILMPCDPAVVLLGMYRKKMKTDVCTKICTCMFITALFITAKTWEEPSTPAKVS